MRFEYETRGMRRECKPRRRVAEAGVEIWRATVVFVSGVRVRGYKKNVGRPRMRSNAPAKKHLRSAPFKKKKESLSLGEPLPHRELTRSIPLCSTPKFPSKCQCHPLRSVFERVYRP